MRGSAGKVEGDSDRQRGRLLLLQRERGPGLSRPHSCSSPGLAPGLHGLFCRLPGAASPPPPWPGHGLLPPSGASVYSSRPARAPARFPGTPATMQRCGLQRRQEARWGVLPGLSSQMSPILMSLSLSERPFTSPDTFLNETKTQATLAFPPLGGPGGVQHSHLYRWDWTLMREDDCVNYLFQLEAGVQKQNNLLKVFSRIVYESIGFGNISHLSKPKLLTTFIISDAECFS